ncbi:hypothetical protein PR003_g5779 [Phytophthora rubi]|nr:hypothetical protein PR003_g5779 [Phytophthora rubi]
MLKQCEVVGELPKKGKFLKIFEWTDVDCGKLKNVKAIGDIVHFIGSQFYVRKEVLCVLENFRKIYQSEFDSGEMVYKQFVLMGSPGTGKSCILALLCFFIAIKVKRPVLWLRQDKRGKVGGTTTRLFYQGKYYEWKDPEGTMYRSIYDALNNTVSDTNASWCVLDGLDKRDIKDRKWFDKFTLLATSGQFPPNSVPVHFFRLCLVPYWKQSDLEEFGRKHMQIEESDVDARLFVSAGSLGKFLDDDAEATVKPAIDRIKKPEDAEILLTKYRLSGNMQNDHVRMRGVYDRNNADHYVDVGEWIGCVTSKLVLHHLAAMMKPNFFEELMRIARGVNDDRLEDITFEAYFHSLVYHRRSMCVEYCKYDNVNRETVNNWENNLHADVGSIEWKELSVVE